LRYRAINRKNKERYSRIRKEREKQKTKTGEMKKPLSGFRPKMSSYNYLPITDPK